MEGSDDGDTVGSSDGDDEGEEEGVEEGFAEGKIEGDEEGLEEGLQKGLQKGRLDATRQLVLSLTADRFGPLPADIRQRIESMPAPALEQTALRLRRVASLDDLLSDKPS